MPTGAQMKTTHNLRLLSCDICHLCDMPHNELVFLSTLL